MNDIVWTMFIAALLIVSVLPAILIAVAMGLQHAQSRRTAISLGAIHTLVNSNLTSARQDQLDATRVMLASLRELAAFKEQQGVSVSSEAVEAIELAQRRVTDLARDIEHKQDQTDIADAQARRQSKS